MSLKRIIELADRQRKDMCLCLLGDPGIGKTQAVYEFAREYGRNVVEIIASQIMPNEVSGITMPVEETHSMEIFDHARLSSLKDGDILFFDELLAAAPTTLSACLTLIQERRMMSGKMLPDVLIIAAANKLASPGQVPLSIRQRFMFYECRWNRITWKQYIASTYGITPSDGLLNMIETSGDNEYNILTPRSATKLISWLSSCNTDEEMGVVLNAIGHMYNSSALKNVFEQMFFTCKDEKQQILEAVYQMNPSLKGSKVYSNTTDQSEYQNLIFDNSFDSDNDEYKFKIRDSGGDDIDSMIAASNSEVEVKTLEDCTIAELYGLLSGMPGWQEVAEKLSSIEWKDKNKLKF